MNSSFFCALRRTEATSRELPARSSKTCRSPIRSATIRSASAPASESRSFPRIASTSARSCATPTWRSTRQKRRAVTHGGFSRPNWRSRHNPAATSNSIFAARSTKTSSNCTFSPSIISRRRSSPAAKPSSAGTIRRGERCPQRYSCRWRKKWDSSSKWMIGCCETPARPARRGRPTCVSRRTYRLCISGTGKSSNR